MTRPRDPDRLLAAYLADGMDALPDRVAEAVRAEVHRTRQRTVIGPWRMRFMNSAATVAVGAAAAVALVAVGINLLPASTGPGGLPPVSPSPLATPTPSASASPTVDVMRVAGTEQGLTVELPPGWANNGYAAAPGDGDPGALFFVSVPAYTLPDPCDGTAPGPAIDPTVEAVVTAITQIPGVPASAPRQVTVAGYDASYIELSGPSILPCPEVYLWLDSPEGGWWISDPNETLGVYVLDVDEAPVVIAARFGPDTTDDDRDALGEVLETIVIDSGS